MDATKLKLKALAQAAADHGEKIGENEWYGEASLPHIPITAEPDMKFICAAEPGVVLELFDLVERQEAELAALRYSAPQSQFLLTDEDAETASLTESMRNLALAIWRDNYKADSPNFEVLPDAPGILSQIDNMVCGMSRAAKLQAQCAAPNERARFEAWMREECGADDDMLKRPYDGRYVWGRTGDMWATWKAARAAIAPTQPVAASEAASVGLQSPDTPIGYISHDALIELQDPNAPDNPLTLRHSKSVHRRAEVPVYLTVPPPAPVAAPFAHFIQPGGFGPFIECEASQIGAFPAYRAAAPAVAEGCAWTEVEYAWDSACGETWHFIDGSSPDENNVRFCHGCGKPIVLPAAPSAPVGGA